VEERFVADGGSQDALRVFVGSGSQPDDRTPNLSGDYFSQLLDVLGAADVGGY
jgi:hypothetical protein